jgi:hypothetical protein
MGQYWIKGNLNEDLGVDHIVRSFKSCKQAFLR